MKKVSDEQDFCRGTGSLWRVLCGKHTWVGVWCTCLCECMMSESFNPCFTFLSKIVQPARPQHPPASAFPALGSEAHTTRHGFLTGVGDPSSGPYARTANTFPTEPSLQPPYQDSLPEHYQISLILKSHRDSNMNQFLKNSWPLLNFKMAYDTSNHSSNNTILECTDFVEGEKKLSIIKYSELDRQS